MQRWCVAVVLAVLAGLVLSGAVAAEPTATDDRVETGAASNDTQETTIRQTQRLRLTPDSPGVVTVRLQYDLPAAVTELETRVPGGATVTGTDGFAASGGRYAWDGETASPSLTYDLPVNETREPTGPLAGRGSYLFVDPGPWALVRTPQVGASWQWRGTGDVTLSRSATAAGEGAVGESIAFLGPLERRTERVNGQTFELVIPAAADMSADPDEVFASVGAAGGRLQVGDRDDRVVMFVAPTTQVQWGVLGLQTGERDLWVRDNEGLATADNVWLHEYVHTRQDFRTTAQTRWLTEASATYYAALLALRQDRISYSQFADRLALGDNGRAAALADPGSWEGSTPYLQGALVAGELDRRLRLADGGGTFQAVFRDLNAREERVTADQVRGVVGRVGDGTTGTFYDRYTTNAETPSMWSRAEYTEAFQTPLARISYEFPAVTNATSYRVAGPYRNGTVGAGPAFLVPGERLTVPLSVVNDGGAAGSYDARLLVNGIQVERYRGTVAAESTTVVRVGHTFPATGNYTVGVGGARRAVRVREPAGPVVADLTATPATVRSGETVTLRATVRNPSPVPAVGAVALDRNGRPVERRNVTLEPGAEGAFVFERTFAEAGTYRFSLGNRTATVTVRNETATDATAGDGPGFGVSAAALAVATLVVLARRRR